LKEFLGESAKIFNPTGKGWFETCLLDDEIEAKVFLCSLTGKFEMQSIIQ
jgi:hypothetical protein